MYGLVGIFGAARFGLATQGDLLNNNWLGGHAEGVLDAVLVAYLAISIPPIQVWLMQLEWFAKLADDAHGGRAECCAECCAGTSRSAYPQSRGSNWNLKSVFRPQCSVQYIRLLARSESLRSRSCHRGRGQGSWRVMQPANNAIASANLFHPYLCLLAVV